MLTIRLPSANNHRRTASTLSDLEEKDMTYSSTIQHSNSQSFYYITQ